MGQRGICGSAHGVARGGTGRPDAGEKARGLNPGDSSDGNMDANGDGYLGEGKIAMTDAAKAMRAIDSEGWVVLETPCPSSNPEADTKRNIQYVRKLMA
jgi:hypothetical protein